MPEIIFFEAFALLLLGMLRCEIDSWRDRPLVINGVMITMPSYLDILDQEFYELPPQNMNDCLLKQQLKEEYPINIIIGVDEKIKLPDVIFNGSEDQ